MKSKIIEVIGPPGAGKSTIYKALCAAWTPAAPWTHQDALLAPAKPSWSQLTAWLEYNFKVMLGRSLMKSIPVDYGLRFSDSHKDFANFCWNHLTGSQMPLNREISNRFRSSYFLFNDFCRYQAILEKSDSVPCLIEEGFLQKSFLLHDDGELLNTILEVYLQLIPLPYAILLVDTPEVALITQRLTQRQKVIASHINVSAGELMRETKKWQQLLYTATSTLEKNGVQVYRLDAEKPVQENVATALAYLSNMK